MNPEILCQAHIPKPLHGLNPRVLMGQEKWDVVRRKAYADAFYKCEACGTPKALVKGKNKWLEAHEFTRLDIKKGVMEVIKIVALCPYCHKFIHSGRLFMTMGKEMDKKETIAVLQHGFDILRENHLRCFYATKTIAEALGMSVKNVEVWGNDGEDGPDNWKKWYLLYEGKKYYSKFEDFDAWRDFYTPGWREDELDEIIFDRYG